MMALLLGLLSPAFAAPLPQPVGFINDFAGILTPETSSQLTNIATSLEKATDIELAVATIKSLDGDPIEDYAVRLFQAWGIGKKGQDNGVLVLVAPIDRSVRIEVGYGLEPLMNDALAGRIIRDTMIPHFKAGDFGLGILNGVVELTSTIAKRGGFEFDPIKAASIDAENFYHVDYSKREASTLSKIFKVIFIIIVILFFIKNPWAALLIFSNFSGGGGSFRGGFGGGFGGFGGGLSGGGGSSGRW
jgi:uncharacterized protein